MNDRVSHDAVHLGVDLFFAPEEARHILDPFKVADGHAAGVTDNVRNHDDTAFGKDIIRFRIGRAVRPFQHQLTGQFFCALARDLAFQRGGDQNVHLGGPEGIFVDFTGARETGNLLLLSLPCGQGGHINAPFVIQGGGVVLNHHDPRAYFGEQTSGFATDVTKTLQRHFRAFNFNSGTAGDFTAGNKDAATGRFFTSQRTAEVNRLAGHHAGNRGAMVHGIGIHHPRHYFTVGADVRGRNIFLRPDNQTDFAGIAAGQTLQLAF